MKRAFATWMWSLGVVARSYRTVVVLAALIALWAWAAYQWLGLPESSALLLILAFIWAIVQLVATAMILCGTVLGATVAAATERDRLYPINLFWIGIAYRKRLLGALLFCLVSCIIIALVGSGFNWINLHSLEVASFLTFHSQKPVSHVLVANIYQIIEGLVWIGLSGFLGSFFILSIIEGWMEALKRTGKLLVRCAFRTPFLTSLLSVVVFGGAAYKLVNWHPGIPPGFWDYTQMIARFILVLVLVSAGWLFWLLSLARLTISIKAREVSVRHVPAPGKP